jgi:cytochrome c551/c552
MNRGLFLIAGFAVSTPALAAVAGDAERGKQVFDSLKCVTCHSVAGAGGKSAPDLARREARGSTPADLAAAMWNHAPQMWAAMEKAGIAKSNLTTEQAADLFAWFQAGRYFEKPGDAAKGKSVFAAKGCSGCHAAGAQPGSEGPAVGRWESVSDPIELARQMWNHAPGMQAAIAAKGGKAPELTAAEMNDIIAYATSLRGAKGQQGQFSPGPAETGQTLIEAKGCNSCHKGAQALPGKTNYTVPAEVAAAMWNHAARMKHSGQMRPEEMRRIAGYLWSRQFENEGGNAARGEQLFKQKACAGCHGSSAPYLAHGEESSSYGMVAVLWRHGPEMLSQMKSKKVAWPQFTGVEVSDVIAYMKSAK